MPILTLSLTVEEASHLLELEEGHFCDLKAREIAPGKLGKHLAAFANADGGELYIGIAEIATAGGKLRTWNGFTDIESANGHIQVLEQFFPLGNDFTYEFLASPSHPGIVLKIGVRKTRAILKAADSIAYVRRGAQSLPMTDASTLSRLERNKGITSFETEPVAAPLTTITNSETILGFMLDIVPAGEPADWIAKNQLATDEKPTVAGIVLFADLPQAILPKRCGIKIYRYKSDRSEGLRESLVGLPLSLEGSAYTLIKDAVSKTQEILNDLQILGPSGLEKVDYPPEALHEVITNAVLHRDYSIADDVHVRVFDNRVEVESPGTLPAHITPENILKERFSRNGNIVRIINKFPDPPNKDIGEGLNTAFAAMRRLRLREPKIEAKNYSVVVHIRHERLASPEEIVIEYLKSNSMITNPIARKLCAIESENAMKSVFYRLRDAGQLEQVPGLRGNRAAWQKTSNGSTNESASASRQLLLPVDPQK